VFKIYDGRNNFYQWDLDRKLIVYDESIKEVHFCNKTDDCSLVCEVYTEGNLRLVNVPNVLLQDNWRINVYGYDSNYTKHEKRFDVKSRTKPADYVYTETEVKNFEELEARIDQIEKNGVSDEAVANAINKYMELNPIDINDLLTTDKTLTLSNDGRLSVNTTNDMEQDNTLPITSAGVFVTVGNIEALLKTI
jgi:hypothetical protein